MCKFSPRALGRPSGCGRCWQSAESQGSPRLWRWLCPMPASRTPGCLTQPPGHMETVVPAALRPEALLPAATSVRTLPCDPGPREGGPLQGPPLGGHHGPGEGSWLIPQVDRAGQEPGATEGLATWSGNAGGLVSRRPRSGCFSCGLYLEACMCHV